MENGDEQETAGEYDALTAEEEDARLYLETWRAMRPEHFEARVEAMVKAVKAIDLLAAGWPIVSPPSWLRGIVD